MWGYLPSYSAPPRTFLVVFALLFGVAGVVFARTPKLIPEDLANQMETSTSKLVFGLLYDRRDNKEDVYAFGSIANKVATYFEMGSVIETPPDLLLSELIVHCDTPERPSVTLFIVSLCKSYKYLYDTSPDNVAAHEQYLGITASGLRKGTAQFLARYAQDKDGSGGASTCAGSLGSGFIISPDGYILTNNHVIAHSTRITVVVPGHGPVNASVVRSDPSRDLALLRIPISNLPYLSIGDSDLVHVLNTIYVLGYPLSPVLGGDVSASEGKINAIRDERRGFQFDADVNPGNSGGPLLNDKGEVIGVVVAKLDAIKMLKELGSLPERINFAIPVNEARQLVGNVVPLPFASSARESVLSPSDIFDTSKGATVFVTATADEQSSSTGEPEPTAPRAELNPTPDYQERVLAFVREFVAASRSGSRLRAPISFYGPNIVFNGRQLTRQAMAQQIQSAFAQWPKRAFHLISGPTIVGASQDQTESVVAYEIAFAFRNEQRHFEGKAAIQLTVQIHGDQLAITSLSPRIMEHSP